ncbi:hypothetical protein [Hyalangium versicolor]|uniref:hypothetical protein n=1 Tax=Hyalangium versicolor TaxID=2861190 RepID=UPI001CCBF4B3|nr:hypothetical protein [Hyalangium versicolor]
MAHPLMSLLRGVGIAFIVALMPGLAAAQGEAPAPPSVEGVGPSASDVPRAAPVLEPAPMAVEGPLGTLPPLGSALSPPSRPGFRVLPVLASVVPGLLFHGMGPLVAGDTHSAGRLFAMEGTGLGLLAVGGVPIALTGASRRVIGPLYTVCLAGAGIFSLSAMANIYSVVSPAFTPGVAAPRLPPLELDFGYQHVSDPNFDYRHFVVLGATARLDSTRLEAAVRLSPNEGNARVRLGGAYRLLGEPEQARGGADGTALDFEGGVLYHRFPTEGFVLLGGEVGLRGRYAMARLSPRLEGSFAEVSAGLALQGYSFFGPINDDALHEQVLFTFGYGVYLGRSGPLRGEALLYYDHRKDDYAGGLKFGAGVPGYFGLRGRVLLSEHWGVSADVQAGSAYVARVSAVYTIGGEP